MTPTHRESDTKVRRGSITKQGSRLLRWAAVEAVSKNHGHNKIKNDYRRIAERRGRNIARVAAARRLAHPRVLRATRRRDPLPRATRRQVEPTRTQPADRLGKRRDPSGRQYVIEHCWLRRTAPCWDPDIRWGPAKTCPSNRARSACPSQPVGNWRRQRNASSTTPPPSRDRLGTTFSNPVTTGPSRLPLRAASRPALTALAHLQHASRSDLTAP